jgi:DNA-binding CsgD family transcriptional regulator
MVRFKFEHLALRIRAISTISDFEARSERHPMKQQVQGEVTGISPSPSKLPAKATAAIFSNSFSSRQSLTRQERVVLKQVIRGASSKETGRILGISPRTVEFHRAHIRKKLGAKNTAHLVRIVSSRGIDH